MEQGSQGGGGGSRVGEGEHRGSHTKPGAHVQASGVVSLGRQVTPCTWREGGGCMYFTTVHHNANAMTVCAIHL